MRLLHTADWHLGKSLEGRSRLPEQEQVMDELCEMVEKESVDVILMAGDVFDTVNPPAAAEQLFYESVARMADYGKRKVVIIAGNHDNPERLVAATSLAREHGITLVGKPIARGLTIEVPSCEQLLSIAALPYPSEARLNELLDVTAEEEVLQLHYHERVKRLFQELCQSFGEDTVNVAMSHLFVAGGQSTDSERPIQVGGAYTVYPEALPVQAQYVALGHLHRPQTIRAARTMARYAGSPLAYSFSESGYAKSVTLLDAQPGGDVHSEELMLRSGKPLVSWKATEGLPQVYDWLEQDRDKDAWIDLEIHLQHALSLEDIHRLRKLHDGFIHIRPVFEEFQQEEQRQRMADLPIEQLFTRFYERQTGGAKPEDELVDLFVQLINKNA